MGRRGPSRQKQERALAQALTQALATGVAQGERRTYQAVLGSIVSEVLGLEVRDVAGLIEQVGPQKALPLITQAALDAWPTRYRERLSPVLSALMQWATKGAAPVLGSFTLQSPRMAEYFEGYMDKLGADLSETSRANAERVIEEAMSEGLSNPDTASRLRERLPELNGPRSELIARNETHRASVVASEIQARESGVPIRGRTWQATKDDRTRPAHLALDGVTVGMDEPFPGGINSPAEEIGCRCVVLYRVDTDALRELTA